MNRASVAAAADRWCVSAPSSTAPAVRGLAGAVAVASIWTSALVTRPRGPVPVASEVSTPWSAANRWATGDVAAGRGGCAGAGSAGFSSAGAATFPEGAPAPASIRRSAAPRPRSHPARPAARSRCGDQCRERGIDLVRGHLGRSSPSETWSPTFTTHSSSVPLHRSRPSRAASRRPRSHPRRNRSPLSSVADPWLEESGRQAPRRPRSRQAWPTHHGHHRPDQKLGDHACHGRRHRRRRPCR